MRKASAIVFLFVSALLSYSCSDCTLRLSTFLERYGDADKAVEKMMGRADRFECRTLFTRCRGLEIAGLEFRKTRGWGINFDFCEQVEIHDIAIFSKCKNVQLQVRWNQNVRCPLHYSGREECVSGIPRRL